MNLTTLKKALFKKSTPVRHYILLWSYALFLIITFVLYITIELVHDIIPTEVFNVEDVEDLDFSDIYYKAYNEDANCEKDVVLINIGSLKWKPGGYRESLIPIITEIKNDSAAAIGLDISFGKDTPTDQAVNDSLFDTIKKYEVIIADGHDSKPAKQKGNDAKEPNQFRGMGCDRLFGWTDFAVEEGKTIRSYYINVEKHPNTFSFGYLLYQQYYYKHKENTIGDIHKNKYKSGETSIWNKGIVPLKYYTHHSGYYSALDSVNHNYFPAIEWYDVLSFDDSIRERVKNLVKGKVVIVGSLMAPDMGYDFDSEDKHLVPTDFDITQRNPIMPGAVVHANAVQMFINGDKLYRSEWLNYSVLLILGYFYLYVFTWSEKTIRNIPLQVFSEVFFLFITSYLFAYASANLMRIDIHLGIGQIVIYLTFFVTYKIFGFKIYENLEKGILLKKLKLQYGKKIIS